MAAYAVFDRDGTLIEHVHHLSKLNEIKIKSDAFFALEKLQNAGLRLGIITNQSVIGRKKLRLSELDEIHKSISNSFSQHGLSFDFIYFCPHLVQDECKCRKPETALGIKAIETFGLTPSKSFMIGDQSSDIEFGIGLGMTTICISNSFDRNKKANFSCGSLTEAATWIISQLRHEM
jgi:histidinol-phosphate phosphatase family protein